MSMADDPLPATPAPPSERPWQFSLLDLFGLMTVVSVGAASFYWNPVLGTFVSCTLFLSIATFFRTKAVIRTAAPSLRTRSLSSLIGFGIVTSLVASLAALVAFSVTCTTVGLVVAAVQPPYPMTFIVIACCLGVIPALIVLYRSWPQRPAAK